MIRFAYFVSRSSKCKNFWVLFGEVAASLSASFYPKILLTLRASVPIFASKFGEKKFQPLMG
jgi:hypothetical protein